MSTALHSFVQYCQQHIKGDEKGEAQIFLDRLFTSFGYADGLKGAGAELEFRLKKETNRGTSFADLVWKKRVLIEMKKQGEDLDTHIQQAINYWLLLAGDRPRYIVLCNFAEFWVYDTDKSVYKPVDRILLDQLPQKADAFGFLRPVETPPIFGTDAQDVTIEAAEKVAAVFNSLVKTGTPRENALRYCLQCIIALFAEDVDLLPDHLFTRLMNDCSEYKGNSYDLIGGLFQEMNRQGLTPAGRYQGVDYFNGGLFATVLPLELSEYQISLLQFAAKKNWRNVNPSIFGSIFEAGLEKGERHVLGAHYTHEIDIKKIVDPVIVQPWTERIDAAHTLDELYGLLTDLCRFRVLDPACGSGNFLFMAFREVKLLEKRLLTIVRDQSTTREEGRRLQAFLETYPFVNTRQFYGIDIKPFAVELAKVTLMVAKELSYLDNKELYDARFAALPLDNLDQNIICADALLDGDLPRQWPAVDVIIGNPPYQSKNKMQQELGATYQNRLRTAYPDVPGRADFCVYWFHKAHLRLTDGARAGLVATNTIRQNYSREGSLDYIVKNGGTIFNAVSSQDWSGDAAVFVSVVNWIKGDYTGDKLLYFYDAKNHLHSVTQPVINSSLSLEVDVATAYVLETNRHPKKVFQGQTHGHEGFLLPLKEAQKLLQQHPNYSEVLKPYLTGDELLSNFSSQPERFIIDFTNKDIIQAASQKHLFAIVEKKVLPKRKEKSEKQALENELVLKKDPEASVNKHHINFFNNWWKLAYGRSDLLSATANSGRFICCSRVSSRNIFEFASTDIRPSDVVMIFALEDYYSFGIINSIFHWEWWKAKGSTLAEGPRYTTNTVWDTFPWPQRPTKAQIDAVAQAAQHLHQQRTQLLRDYKMSLRDLYRTLEKPGKNALRLLHDALDKAVWEAYGFASGTDLLTNLLTLNHEMAERERAGLPVQSPGLPALITDPQPYITDDCVRFINPDK